MDAVSRREFWMKLKSYFSSNNKDFIIRKNQGIEYLCNYKINSDINKYKVIPQYYI